MFDIKTFERVILHDLFRSKQPVEVFAFHQKYQLSPAQIIVFLEKYTHEGFAEKIENTVQLTKTGKEYVWKNRFKIFGSNIARSWRPPTKNKNWRQVEDMASETPHYTWMDKRITSLTVDEFSKEIERNNDAGS